MRNGIVFLIVLIYLVSAPIICLGDTQLNKPTTVDEVIKKSNEDIKNSTDYKEDYFEHENRDGLKLNETLLLDRDVFAYGKPFGNYDSSVQRYRYLGKTMVGDEITNIFFPDDSKWDGYFEDKKWIRVPWEDCRTKPLCIGKEFDAKYLKDLYKPNIIAGIKNYYPTRIGNINGSDFNNKDWENYVHILQPPTYYTYGLGRMWHDEGDGLMYITIPLMPFDALKNLAMELVEAPTQIVLQRDFPVTCTIKNDLKTSSEELENVKVRLMVDTQEPQEKTINLNGKASEDVTFHVNVSEMPVNGLNITAEVNPGPLGNDASVSDTRLFKEARYDDNVKSTNIGNNQANIAVAGVTAEEGHIHWGDRLPYTVKKEVTKYRTWSHTTDDGATCTHTEAYTDYEYYKRQLKVEDCILVTHEPMLTITAPWAIDSESRNAIPGTDRIIRAGYGIMAAVGVKVHTVYYGYTETNIHNNVLSTITSNLQGNNFNDTPNDIRMDRTASMAGLQNAAHVNLNLAAKETLASAPIYKYDYSTTLTYKLPKTTMSKDYPNEASRKLYTGIKERDGVKNIRCYTHFDTSVAVPEHGITGIEAVKKVNSWRNSFFKLGVYEDMYYDLYNSEN